MGKKGDLSNFERSMIGGARQGSLSISQSAQLLGYWEQKKVYISISIYIDIYM